MAKKAGTVDPYPASPDGLMAMMQDPEYVNAKYTALQDRSFEVLQLEKTADGHVLKVDRIVDANLPDFAKKVLGDTNRLVQVRGRLQGGGGRPVARQADHDQGHHEHPARRGEHLDVDG